MSIFQRIDASGTSSYLTDALGSTLALADASGGLATSYVYDPFGNTTVTGSSSNPYQFTGREDEGTGLYFYRARYYSPSFQRFIAQDPIDFAGGTVNLYEYAENNPLAFADPFGKQVYPYPPGVPPPKIPRGPVLQPYPPGEPGYQCDRGEPPPPVLPPELDPYKAGNVVACAAGALLCPEDGPGAGTCFILWVMACISSAL